MTSLFLSLPALAEELHVSDGDSLRIDGERIRLWGIDAPELGQKCKRQGVSFDCGITAREVLISLIGKNRPECEQIDTDRYGCTVARCTVGGLDLASMMVNAGWAVDFERYSKGAYAEEEREARLRARGCGLARSFRQRSGGGITECLFPARDYLAELLGRPERFCEAFYCSVASIPCRSQAATYSCA